MNLNSYQVPSKAFHMRTVLSDEPETTRLCLANKQLTWSLWPLSELRSCPVRDLKQHQYSIRDSSPLEASAMPMAKSPPPANTSTSAVCLHVNVSS